MPRHPFFVCPFQDGSTGELLPIVTDIATGLTVDSDQSAEFPGNPCPGQAGIGNQAQAFAGAVIDHR